MDTNKIINSNNVFALVNSKPCRKFYCIALMSFIAAVCNGCGGDSSSVQASDEPIQFDNAKSNESAVPRSATDFDLSFAQDLNRPPTNLALNQPKNKVDPMIADKHTAMFFPSRISTEGKFFDDHEFQDPKVCAGCHAKIYQEWESSVMAMSWKDPIYRALLERASEATNGAVDNFCIGCHSPVGLTTNNATATGEDNLIADRGVDCEGCHNISNVEGAGNGAFVLTPNKFGRPLKFGPRSDAVSPYHDTAYSDVHTKSEFCSTCHNVTHPFNKLPIERTYDEWRDSLYNSQGIECQDCHMTPGPGVQGNPGKSAVMGKEREHVYSHQFASANVTLLKHFGKEQAANDATEMLRSAATMQFVNVPGTVTAGQNEMISLKVSNTGAGHKLPTGFPEGREVWVDFKVTDKQGNTIYRLGAIKDGRTEANTKNFKAILGDKNGDVVDINVWEADRVLADTRILPNSFALLEYAFSVPVGVEGPLTITAVLNYWPFPQYIVDKLLGQGEMKVEITEMTSVIQTLDVVKPKFVAEH